MSIHYTSLLIAVASSGAAVLLAAITSWMHARSERYLVLAAIGLGMVSTAVGLMAVRDSHANIFDLSPSFTLLLAGLSLIYASVRIYMRKPAIWVPTAVGGVSIVAMNAAFATGYFGAGNAILNTASGLILILSGLEYLRSEDEMRATTRANAVLYIMAGATFLLCAGFVVSTGDLVSYPVIDDWVDNLNAVTSLAGVSGIGTLTLVLHFARSARHQRSAANTDVLTGVLNRRALFDRYPEMDMADGLAVLVFDLDHFKTINDQLGHAHGDSTLQRFAEVMHAHAGQNSCIARIGGEEFCMVMEGTSHRDASIIAETIRAEFAALGIPCGKDGAVATVSVGLATGGSGEPFHSALGRADAALYKAKNGGRNKLCSDSPVLAA